MTNTMDYNELISSEEFYIELEIFAGTHSYEEFIEYIPDLFSDSLEIPDWVYEEYVYLRNHYDEHLRWQDLLRKEVF